MASPAVFVGAGNAVASIANTTAFARRQRQTKSETGIRRAKDLTPQQRARIFDACEALFIERQHSEISSVVAHQLGIEERLVDEVIVGFAIQHRVERNNYDSGMKNVRALALEAGQSVWTEE